MSNNIVTFGLKNVCYSLIQNNNGNISYSKSKRLPYAQEMSIDLKGGTSSTFADDKTCAIFNLVAGYTMTMKLTELSDEFKIDILGYKYDKNNNLVETNKTIPVPFAIGYEISGDVKKRRVWHLFCSADPISFASKSKTDSVEANSISLTINTYNMILKKYEVERVICNEDDSHYNAWNKKRIRQQSGFKFKQTVNGVEVTNTIENTPNRIVLRRNDWSRDEFHKNGTSEIILDSKGLHLNYSFPDPRCSGGIDDNYWTNLEMHIEDGQIALKSRQDQEDSGYGTEAYFGLLGFRINKVTYEDEDYINDSFNPQQHVVLHQVRFAGAGKLGPFTLSMLTNFKDSIQNTITFYQNTNRIVGCSSMEGGKGFLYGGVSDDAKSLIYYVYDASQEVYIKKQALINFEGMQDNVIVLY